MEAGGATVVLKAEGLNKEAVEHLWKPCSFQVPLSLIFVKGLSSEGNLGRNHTPRHHAGRTLLTFKESA